MTDNKQDRQKYDIYGKPMKKLIFHASEEDHHNLKIKLQYDKVTQASFFRACITAYLKDDPLMRELIMRISPLSKDNKEIVVKNHKKAQETKEKFGLNEEQRTNIFDILEMSHPEL